MNILHLSAVKDWGGGGNHIENLCTELSKTNPEIKNIIVVAENGLFHERLKNSNFGYDTVPMNLKVNPLAVYKIIKLCRKEAIDLIHIHGSTSLTLAVLANTFKSLPPFVFSRKTSFPIKSRKQTLYKYNHPNIKRILCVSECSKKIAEEAIKDKSKLQVIYHGTRIDNKSSETPFSLKEKLQIPASHKIVGNIANHIKAKDLKTWVKTIDVLVNKMKISDVSFVQIGSFSSLTPDITNLVHTLGLDRKIHFLGYLSGASNFMTNFNVLLQTSMSEGLPQVIFEAFYHRVPVVSTSVGGIPEIIDHRQNGLLSPQGDSESLAKYVAEILNNAQLSTDFAKNGYEKLFPIFTSENMARETLRVYEDILKEQMQ